MPFQSKSQRRWMYENKPEMARRWQRDTPTGAKLPEKVSKPGYGRHAKRSKAKT